MYVSLPFAPFSALVWFLVMLYAKPSVFLVTFFLCHSFPCGATGVDAAVPPSPAVLKTAAYPPPIPGGYPTGNVAALNAAAACRASTAPCAAAVVAAIAAVRAGPLPPPPSRNFRSCRGTVEAAFGPLRLRSPSCRPPVT